MADIFISYNRRDREWASALALILESIGWSVWWDRRLVAGDSFNEIIDDELEKAKCIIVLWSKNSVKSRWVIDEAEVGIKKRILFPIIIEEVAPPLGFRSIQSENLANWDKSAESDDLRQLAMGLTSILGNPYDRIYISVSLELSCRQQILDELIYDAAPSLGYKDPKESFIIHSGQYRTPEESQMIIRECAAVLQFFEAQKTENGISKWLEVESFAARTLKKPILYVFVSDIPDGQKRDIAMNSLPAMDYSEPAYYDVSKTQSIRISQLQDALKYLRDCIEAQRGFFF